MEVKSPIINIVLNAYQELATSINKGMAEFGYEDFNICFEVGNFKITEEEVKIVADVRITVPVNLSVAETQSSETVSSEK
jgi:hypothetical protein